MHRGKGLGMYMAEGASSLAEAEEKEVSLNLSLLRIRTCSTMSSLVVAWLEDDPLVGPVHAWEGRAWGRLVERETGLVRRACKLGVGPAR